MVASGKEVDALAVVCLGYPLKVGHHLHLILFFLVVLLVMIWSLFMHIRCFRTDLSICILQLSNGRFHVLSLHELEISSLYLCKLGRCIMVHLT